MSQAPTPPPDPVSWGPDAAGATGNIGPWSELWRPEPALESAFADLIDALRRLQDAAAGSRPTIDAAREATGWIEAAADRLGGYQVGEREQLAGKLSDLPGRAQSLVPVVEYEEADSHHTRAHVTFGRFYLGGGGAVHGGALPLIFDELFGRLAGAGGRPRSRTAYLLINYRRITPLGRQLQLLGSVQRFVGRKITITGTLHDGDTLLCDAEGLFLTLNPGQP